MYKRTITIILLILMPVFNILLPQGKKDRFQTLGLDKEKIYADPLIFYNTENSKDRLDLYIEIPFKILQFKKSPGTNNFVSGFDVTILIKDGKDNTITNPVFSENISQTEDEQKNKKDDSYFTLKQFDLAPGKYKLNIVLWDKNSSKETTREFDFNVKGISNGSVSFSDLMILSDYKIGADGKKEITPLVNNNIGNLREFSMFFEIYNRTDTTLTKEYTYRLKNTKDVISLEGSLNYTLEKGVNKKVETYKIKDFLIGDYKFEIIDKATQNVVAEKNILYKWDNFPVNLNDLDLAIDQLVYMADRSEISFIRDGKSNEEKLKRFIQFWKDKDPTPNTPQNEIMIEYYNRIKIANEKFTHYIAGWKSDMGMVFIYYGEPGNIERHPYDMDSKPYEVWDYYDINRRFIFVDYSGFGDYRLTTPIWDETPRFKW